MYIFGRTRVGKYAIEIRIDEVEARNKAKEFIKTLTVGFVVVRKENFKNLRNWKGMVYTRLKFFELHRKSVRKITCN